jgi:hypothetical protein
VDAALHRLGSDSRLGLEGLTELVECVRRLEAKLDRVVAASATGSAVASASAAPAPNVQIQECQGEGAREVEVKSEPTRSNDPEDLSVRSAPEKSWGGSARRLNSLEQEGQERHGPSVLLPRKSQSPRSVGEAEHLPPARPQKAPVALAEDGVVACVDAQPADRMEVMDLKLDGIDKKVERIASAVGARLGTGINEEEDRRRLKEKLKEALESAQRNRLQLVESESEVWLEYIFGICKPDGRIGKMGSRRVLRASIFKLEPCGEIGVGTK